MAAAGVVPFNGLHLRMEADAEDWGMLMGGGEVRGLSLPVSIHTGV